MSDIVRQVEEDGRRALWWFAGGLLVLLVAGYAKLGLYSIQPIGMVPLGKTYVVLREGDEPFFNSPDATCERRVGAVSLFCRMQAIRLGPLADEKLFASDMPDVDPDDPRGRVLLVFRFQHWAYDLSVDGRQFER